MIESLRERVADAFSAASALEAEELPAAAFQAAALHLKADHRSPRMAEHEVDLAVGGAGGVIAEDPPTEWYTSQSSSSPSRRSSNTRPSPRLLSSGSMIERGYMRTLRNAYHPLREVLRRIWQSAVRIRRRRRAGKMPRTFAPMVGWIVRDGLRRLTGRPRSGRRASTVGAAAPPTMTKVEPAPVPVADSWASEVLLHAEAVMAGIGVGRPAPRRSSTPFEELDLGSLPDAIAEVVRQRGSVPVDDLVDALRGELRLGELPRNHERLLGRMVWSAKGRGAIDLRDDRWIPGTAAPVKIPELEGRSLESLVALAHELRHRDTSEEALFRAMLDELAVSDGRSARIVAISAGAAIATARRRGLLPFDRGGQAHLMTDLDE